MVKKIKFNLIVDNNPIRDLEGLRNNFNIDDLLRHYHNDLLKKWLDVRGYNDVLSQINSISAQDDLNIARELVRIFEIEIDANRIEEALHSIQYHKQWQKTINNNDRNNFWYQSLINDYCKDYDELLQNILDNKNNMPLIKMSIKQISEVYLGIFKHHLPSFFDEFIKKAPLAIFASLMNPILRDVFFSSESIKCKIHELTNEIFNSCPDSFFYEEYKKNNLSESTFSRNTQNEWYDLHPQNRKCLIVELTNSDNVKLADAKTKTIISGDEGFYIPNISNAIGNIIGLFNSEYSVKKAKKVGEKKLKQKAIGKIFDGLKFSSNSSAYVKYVLISEQTYASLTELAKKEIILRKLFHILANHIRIYKGDTQEYWDVIEPKDKKFMIIGMREGNFVRSAGNDGEKLSAEDVNGKFPILDGIDYMSNNPDHEIGYLEV